MTKRHQSISGSRRLALPVAVLLGAILQTSCAGEAGEIPDAVAVRLTAHLEAKWAAASAPNVARDSDLTSNLTLFHGFLEGFEPNVDRRFDRAFRGYAAPIDLSQCSSRPLSGREECFEAAFRKRTKALTRWLEELSVRSESGSEAAALSLKFLTLDLEWDGTNNLYQHAFRLRGVAEALGLEVEVDDARVRPGCDFLKAWEPAESPDQVVRCSARPLGAPWFPSIRDAEKKLAAMDPDGPWLSLLRTRELQERRKYTPTSGPELFQASSNGHPPDPLHEYLSLSLGPDGTEEVQTHTGTFVIPEGNERRGKLLELSSRLQFARRGKEDTSDAPWVLALPKDYPAERLTEFQAVLVKAAQFDVFFAASTPWVFDHGRYVRFRVLYQYPREQDTQPLEFRLGPTTCRVARLAWNPDLEPTGLLQLLPPESVGEYQTEEELQLPGPCGELELAELRTALNRIAGGKTDAKIVGISLGDGTTLESMLSLAFALVETMPADGELYWPARHLVR